ncbi:MAG TPA: putative ABC transporter permease [Candidatus Faecimonas gallistercoris]|nr:putative ABC transporter permease [Candidatus Faecimonas gallistercoris]
MYYLNLFFINSMIGYLLETGLKTFFFPNMNNGILFGPWIPVYGFGVVIVAYVSKIIFHRLNISKLWKTVLLFFTVFILLSLLEWLGGVIIEKLFHKEFWSYRDQKYNLGPYISLGMSMLWGGASLLLVYVVLPLEEKFIKKIPRGFTFLALILFVVDCAVTWWLA